MNSKKMTSSTRTMTGGQYCPRCSSRMELEVGAIPTGDAFLLNSFHIDMYRCPKCGRKGLGGPIFGM